MKENNMSAIGAILTEEQIKQARSRVAWEDGNKALLVDTLYVVLTNHREDQVSPFDPFRMKLPDNIHTANCVKDIFELLPDHTRVYDGYGMAELIKENHYLRSKVKFLETGQRTREPWEVK
jgi:hypothetical protein